VSLKNIYRRLKGAILFGMYSFKHPEGMNQNNMEGLMGLYELIFKVAETESPYMSRIGVVDCDTGKKIIICSIWVGPGTSADPTNRITELLKENETLKYELSKCIQENKVMGGEIMKDEKYN